MLLRGWVHRLGGVTIENFRLKSQELTLVPPGISVLLGEDPATIAEQVRRAFPGASALVQASRVIASATIEDIRAVGFDVMSNPTRRFPSHCRLVHSTGESGFSDENLIHLMKVFVEYKESDS